MCTWHIVSRCYTTDLHVVNMTFQRFVPLWHQGLYTGIEEIGVNCLYSR